jgi:hypothetical protein
MHFAKWIFCDSMYVTFWITYQLLPRLGSWGRVDCQGLAGRNILMLRDCPVSSLSVSWIMHLPHDSAFIKILRTVFHRQWRIFLYVNYKFWKMSRFCHLSQWHISRFLFETPSKTWIFFLLVNLWIVCLSLAWSV